MGFVALGTDCLAEVCSYLGLEEVLKLLATGDRFFAALFAPGVVPTVTVNVNDIPKTFRKTLIYFLNYHRNIRRYTVHYSPWNVALPFLSEIPSDSSLKEILAIPLEYSASRKPGYEARNRDLETLRGSQKIGYMYPVFDRFENLERVEIRTELPSARKLPSYRAYWLDHFTGMPKSLRELRVIARGYEDAINALSALPREMEVLSMDESSEEYSSVLATDLTRITMETFPRLRNLMLRIPTLTQAKDLELLTEKPVVAPDTDFNLIEISNQVLEVTLVAQHASFPKVNFRAPTATENKEFEGEAPEVTQTVVITHKTNWRSSGGFTDPLIPLYTIQRLPKSLASLDLSIAVAMDSKTVIDLLKALPEALEVLKLSRSFCVQGMEAELPRGLLKASWTAHPPDAWELDFAALPPRLTHLSSNCLLNSETTLIDSAPKTLKSLSCQLSENTVWTDKKLVALQNAATNSFSDLARIAFRIPALVLTGLFGASSDGLLDLELWRANLFKEIPLLEVSPVDRYVVDGLPPSVTELDTRTLALTSAFFKAPAVISFRFVTTAPQLQKIVAFGVKEAHLIEFSQGTLLLPNLTCLECDWSPDILRMDSLPPSLTTLVVGAPAFGEEWREPKPCNAISDLHWSRITAPHLKTLHYALSPIDFRTNESKGSPESMSPAHRQDIISNFNPSAFPNLTSLCFQPHLWDSKTMNTVLAQLPGLREVCIGENIPKNLDPNIMLLFVEECGHSVVP